MITQDEKAAIAKEFGGPAFPTRKQKPLPGGGVLNDVDGGMTLRDYFAAKAMAGILSNPDKDYYNRDLADTAYEIADAMLEARK